MALLPTIRNLTQQTGIGQGGPNGRMFYQYPSDLGNTTRGEHYVMFFINVQGANAVKYGSGAVNLEGGGDLDTSPTPVRNRPQTLTIKRAATKQLSAAIALYMPSTVSVNHKANYGEPEIGAAVSAVMNSIDNFRDPNMTIGSAAWQSLTDAAKVAVNEGVYVGLRAAEETIAPGSIAAYEITRGEIRNNRTEMKFEGIDRRSFQFEFRMLPKNQQEADQIEQIVTAFRYHSMPDIVGDSQNGRTMRPPSTFDIEYHPNTHLYRIAESILESVEVSYGGERPQFFHDDHPVETKLTLQFKELGIITKKEIAEGY